MKNTYKIPSNGKTVKNKLREVGDTVYVTPNEHQMKMIEKRVYARYDEEHQGDIDRAIVNCVSISMMVLRKLYGFGPKRMSDFFQEYCYQLNCIAEAYVTIQDFIDIIYDECKVPIDSEEVALAIPNLPKLRRKIEEERKHDSKSELGIA